MRAESLLSFFSLAAVETRAAVLPRSAPQNDRSWQAAVQNINGMISIITLLPVLTGKAQNVKLIASRIIPGSFIIAGIGAGRVLAKLQVGIFLCSFDLYRNTVGELSYPHDELVNKFSPTLYHIPTDTPERHANGAYTNHNPSEVYMVEAWFRAQGRPVVVELHQNNYTRIAIGFFLYLVLYAGETFLSAQNAAIGTKTVFLVIQFVSVSLWLMATILVQLRKGQGKREIELNHTGSSTYRCFRLPVLGSHVSSTMLSFHLNNLQGYQIFGSRYEQPVLVIAGSMILFSAVLDMLSTVLIVGKTAWAYPWVGVELLILLAKVVFCVEPLRQMEIRDVSRQDNHQHVDVPKDASAAVKMPLEIHFDSNWECVEVTTQYNIILEQDTGVHWKSTTAGLSIGQIYEDTSKTEPRRKHLALARVEKKLGLVDDAPELQSNQALDREFLAALAAVVIANKIPSRKFVNAVEAMMASIEKTMAQTWWGFGSKDLKDAVAAAKTTLIWRELL